jgi:hypothetical protein
LPTFQKKYMTVKQRSDTEHMLRINDEVKVVQMQCKMFSGSIPENILFYFFNHAVTALA